MGRGAAVSWFRVDDKSAFHRKILRAGNECWGAFCRAGATSAGEGTDGRVTLDTCLAIAPARVWAKLVDAGLAERIEGSSDLLLHDYCEWNPTAAQVRASIESKRLAGSKGGIRKAEAASTRLAAATAAASACHVAAAWQDPSIIPSHPILSPATPENQPQIPDGERAAEPHAKTHARARAHPRVDRKKPSTRQPDAAVGPWLEALAIPSRDDSGWGREVSKWLDHHRAKDSRFVDWAAAWRTWQANAERFGTAPRPDVQRSPGYQATEERKRAAFNAECEAQRLRECAEQGIDPEEIPF